MYVLGYLLNLTTYLRLEHFEGNATRHEQYLVFPSSYAHAVESGNPAGLPNPLFFFFFVLLQKNEYGDVLYVCSTGKGRLGKQGR